MIERRRVTVLGHHLNQFYSAQRRNSRFFISDMHVQNKKNMGISSSISSLTGKCAAQKFTKFYSSNLWTCLHDMVILRSQNKITDVL